MYVKKDNDAPINDTYILGDNGSSKKFHPVNTFNEIAVTTNPNIKTHIPYMEIH
tara:strand:+ start:340 stop:501 length:162 start_codon:yes stop_codon:yes gene_type:complete